MTRPEVALEDVVEGLRAEGLLTGERAERAAQLVAGMAAMQPWYVRAMVGFGAWLASLLLIGFVAGLSIAVGGGGYVVLGLALIVGAVLLRRTSDNDFAVQSALAVSLAGQALFAFGFADLIGSYELEVGLSIVGVVSVVLFGVFPDRIHRVLSVLLAAGSLTTLIYLWELNAVIPFLGPLLAAALVALDRTQLGLMATGKGALIRPLMTGLMLSGFGALLLSTIYVFPELVEDYVFYPRPWISTLLLGALLLYVGAGLRPRLLEGAPKWAAPVVYGLMIAVIAAAWAAPGLLLALIVVMLGAGSGDRLMSGAGIAFLAGFVAAYFYGIEITLLAKSMTLVASGAAVLLARWLILRVLAGPSPGGPADA